MILKYSSYVPSDIKAPNDTLKSAQSSKPDLTGGLGENIGGMGLGMVGHLTNIFGPEIGVPTSAVLGGIGGFVGNSVEQLLKNKGYDFGSALQAGGRQAAWGAIPGGDELKFLKNAPKIGKFFTPVAKGAVDATGKALTGFAEKGFQGVTARTGARVATGYAGGSAAGLISGQKPEDVSGQGAFTGVINAALPGLGSLVSAPIKWLGKSMPKEINKLLIEAPKAKAVQLYRAVQERMVGKANVRYALQNGIINPETPLTVEHLQSGLEKTQSLLTPKNQELQNALSKSNVKVPYQEAFDEMQKVIDSYPPLNNTPDIKVLKTWVSDQLTEKPVNLGVNQVLKGKIVGNIGGGKTKPFKTNEMVSLSTLNKVKSALGEAYGDNKLTNKLYGTIRQYIETRSGLPQEVKSINQELGKLIDIKDNLQKVLDMPGSIAKQHTPEGISETLTKEMSKNPKSFNALVAALSVLGGGVLGAGAGHALGPVGELLGGGAGGVTGYFKLRELLSSPETKQFTGKALGKTFGTAHDVGSKLKLKKALQQLGVRAPGVFQ